MNRSVVPVLLPCLPGDLCSRPYPGHPRGCPNYGKRPTCPPRAERWTPEFLQQYYWLAIWNVFAFGAHVCRMQTKHPDWSRRQHECCLYWQGGARRDLRTAVCAALIGKPPPMPKVEYVPEAHGVDVTATMRSIGIELEWPPKVYAYQVALAYWPV